MAGLGGVSGVRRGAMRCRRCVVLCCAVVWDGEGWDRILGDWAGWNRMCWAELKMAAQWRAASARMEIRSSGVYVCKCVLAVCAE